MNTRSIAAAPAVQAVPSSLEQAQARVAALRELLDAIARRIAVIEPVLQQNAEDANLVYVCCDGLRAVGYMADAGSESSIAGSADHWMLHNHEHQALKILRDNGGAA